MPEVFPITVGILTKCIAETSIGQNSSQLPMLPWSAP